MRKSFNMPTNTSARVRVIGAGLAGCECAYQIAKLGVKVELYDMKPHKKTPAHTSNNLCELVCSNSLRSNQLSNAVGLLKAELSKLGSLIMEAAYKTEVPAGSALAVNREEFSKYVTEKIKSNPLITLHEEEVADINSDEITVIATGPLTSEAMAEAIRGLDGVSELHFYDAAAPIVDFSSVDMNKAFFASRYGKGNPEDYLNLPFTEEEYRLFYDELINAEVAKLHEFDELFSVNRKR